jgi:hypothetical protein
MTNYIISEPYSMYFQKSMVFLLPLAGIPFNEEIKPLKSYLHVKGLVNYNDSEFILEFQRTQEVQDFLTPIVRKSNRLIQLSGLSRSIFILVNLSEYNLDYSHFLSGKYSKLSPFLKQRILNFHSHNPANLPYIHSFLYPDRYFEQYSKLFDVSVDLLKGVGELIDKPNQSKESFIDLKIFSRRTPERISLTYKPFSDELIKRLSLA